LASRCSTKIVAITLCLFSILSLRALHQNTSTIFHRLLSSSSYESCDIGTISLPSQPIIPIYAASYPGSGSQMTHYLFEAVTGLEAGSEWLHRGDTYDHITIKTHYPARQKQVDGNRLMHRVIILIRNPINALPSHYNYLYEKEHDLPDHTAQAPAGDWIKWRDQHFKEELVLWKEHLIHWMTEYQSEHRLVISYERLVNAKMGPIETTRIANFLGRTEGVNVVSPASIPCVWDRVVNYQRVDIDEDGKIVQNNTEVEARKLRPKSDVVYLYNENGEEQRKLDKKVDELMVRRRVKYISADDPINPGNSRRKGDVIHEFSKDQLHEMRYTLNQLRGQFLNEYTLVVILSGYIEEIEGELKSK